jgi:hypothetical protein
MTAILCMKCQYENHDECQSHLCQCVHFYWCMQCIMSQHRNCTRVRITGSTAPCKCPDRKHKKKKKGDS